MSNENTKLTILQTPFGKYLEAHELDMIIKNCKLVSFSTGDYILEQGKKSLGLYIILEGKTFVTAKVLGQGTTNLGTRSRGDFLGEMSFIENSACATSVIAHGDVTCLLITIEFYEMLTLFFREIKYKISKAILEKVFYRLISFKNIITTEMKSADVTARTLFSTSITSDSIPEQIGIEEVGFNQAQLKKLLTIIFTKEEAEEVLKYAKLIRADNHVNIISENEINSSVYFVIRGAVQSSLLQNNKVAKISVLGPINLFTSMSVLSPTYSSQINYKSCEKVILLNIGESELTSLQNSQNALWFKLFDQICLSFMKLERAIEKLDIRFNSELYYR